MTNIETNKTSLLRAKLFEMFRDGIINNMHMNYSMHQMSIIPSSFLILRKLLFDKGLIKISTNMILK